MSDEREFNRDEHGRFVSGPNGGIEHRLTALESTFKAHSLEHSRAQAATEQTAMRLERLVEQTANRLETGVTRALDAVKDTAILHAENHKSEHAAHSQIHYTEKEKMMDDRGRLDIRLAGMNEIRDAMRDLAARQVSRDIFDQHVIRIDERFDDVAERFAVFQTWKDKTTGYAVFGGVGIAVVSGAIGALINSLIQ